MVETADVLVENFRPSVPARLGIDYPRLKKINPRLVYAGLTGYGDTGPLSEKGGFDQVLQSLTGMAVFQGGGPDKPQLVLGSVRSEEHTSELQSRVDLVCRLLLE